MNRAQRRAAQKSNKKDKKPDKEMQNVMGMFELLPDECSACLVPYDKKDKKMVATWKVVVREKEKIVRLYCPMCWNNDKRVIKENTGD